MNVVLSLLRRLKTNVNSTYSLWHVLIVLLEIWSIVYSKCFFSKLWLFWQGFININCSSQVAIYLVDLYSKFKLKERSNLCSSYTRTSYWKNYLTVTLRFLKERPLGCKFPFHLLSLSSQHPLSYVFPRLLLFVYALLSTKTVHDTFICTLISFLHFTQMYKKNKSI